MIDGLTAESCSLYSTSQVALVPPVTPVRFEIPVRAASRSSKLKPIKRRRLPNQIAEFTPASDSVRRSGFGVSPREELNAHALRDTQFAPSGHGKRPGPVCAR